MIQFPDCEIRQGTAVYSLSPTLCQTKEMAARAVAAASASHLKITNIVEAFGIHFR